MKGIARVSRVANVRLRVFVRRVLEPNEIKLVGLRQPLRILNAEMRVQFLSVVCQGVRRDDMCSFVVGKRLQRAVPRERSEANRIDNERVSIPAANGISVQRKLPLRVSPAICINVKRERTAFINHRRLAGVLCDIDRRGLPESPRLSNGKAV